MPSTIYLSLVFHNHQPVGNFDSVFEQAYRSAYLPMLECLERHPRVQVGMHHSGCLRDWLQEHKLSYLERLRALTERGQLEMLSGAYYEPILVALSDEDKIGQIEKLTQAVQDDFRYAPRGMWLAERVWEPHLPMPIRKAGMEYAIVDDTHFKNVGYDASDLMGYFITEEQNWPLAIFPTLFRLRYSIPWEPVEKVIAWLREEAETPLPTGQPKLAFMGDDGEKFGLWPTTYAHVWEGGYMDRLFEALEQNADWIKVVTPSEYMDRFPALGRVYLPTASYEEMGQWVLPAERSWELQHLFHQFQDEGRDDILRYLRGGFWRYFMVKYPEVNLMQKRAMSVSEKVAAMPEGEAKTQAQAHLWAAQCNCAYWHGVFGGIYLFHIRAKNYENLIAAEVLAEGEDADRLKVRQYDFDLDSNDELLLTGGAFALLFDLARGGALREWDYRPARYNLLNIMTRHREGYHRDLEEAAARGQVITPDSPAADELASIHAAQVRAKEAGLEKLLFVDWYQRGALIDHFLRADATLDEFYRAAYPEQGDFANLPYQARWEGDARAMTVTLEREGRVWAGEGNAQRVRVRVRKRVEVRADEPVLRVTYTVTNLAGFPINVRFGVETALGFDGGDSEHCYIDLKGQRRSLGEVAEDRDVTAYLAGTRIRGFEVRAALSAPATLWRFPLETVTISEAGFEGVHQGAVLMQWWPLALAPGGAWEGALRFTLSDLDVRLAG